MIIVGQTAHRLEAVAARHRGMAFAVVDVADAREVEALTERSAVEWPDLDTVVNNAGIQTLVDFAADRPLDMLTIGREIDVNLKGVLHVATAFLPLLRKRPGARLINVGSGLGYVPLAAAPIYSATKAAVHSLTIALRHQLQGFDLQVIELIPPVVATDLHRGQTRRPPRAMTLEDFTKAAMRGLDRGDPEIAVGLAKVLRIGSRIAPRLFLNIVNKERR